MRGPHSQFRYSQVLSTETGSNEVKCAKSCQANSNCMYWSFKPSDGNICNLIPYLDMSQAQEQTGGPRGDRFCQPIGDFETFQYKYSHEKKF